MIVKPKTRGFICTTAHPVGCAETVRRQVEAVRPPSDAARARFPGNVLVIGASTGYGLAARIAATFGYGANTVGVYFERPASGSRTATAGYYNAQAFVRMATEAGHVALDVNGDAFSDDVKREALARIRELPGGKVGLVVYSLAAPKRVDPRSGETYTSTLQPLGAAFSDKTVDFHTGEVSRVEIPAATEEQTAQTVKVMGGEDWLWWMRMLRDEGALEQGAAAVAFSYIGPEVTHAIYTDGTIGRAKADVEEKAAAIDDLLRGIGGKAYVSVNKAIVTQASSAIPVVPLYMSILYRLMKARGTHEGSLEQLERMYERMYGAADWAGVPTDERGRLRLDDWEMDPDLQRAVTDAWSRVETGNVYDLTDLEGYRTEFFRLFGFEWDGVDYGADVEV